MASQSDSDTSAAHEPESVIPVASAARSGGSKEADQLDSAGQTILRLLHKAAGVAEANSRYALDMAQKLSHQPRAAENRSRNWKLRLGFIRTKPTVRSSGCTRSIR